MPTLEHVFNIDHNIDLINKDDSEKYHETTAKYL